MTMGIKAPLPTAGITRVVTNSNDKLPPSSLIIAEKLGKTVSGAHPHLLNG